MKHKFLKTISYLMIALGVMASGASSVGCLLLFIDEPEMPACMIEE